jgi:hypothetical protein
MLNRIALLLRFAPAWVWAAVCSLLGCTIVGAFIPRHLPFIQDEFGYLFAGRTYAGFSLTNPTHPLWRFFESQHILMEPSMMAKYPAGPGLALAVGNWLGDPIYGVWLASAGFAAAFSWMLRGFFSARWSILGGVLIGAQFGLTHYWAQSFWGGALPATGGALVFGGACRIWKNPRVVDALLLGLGIAILMHTRPLEGLLACLVPAALVLGRWLRKDGVFDRVVLARFVLPCTAVLIVAGGFLAYSNLRVTGSAWRLPYLEYEQRYLGTPAFIWQSEHVTPPKFTNRAFTEFYHDYVNTIRQKQPPVPSMLAARLRLLARDYLGWILGVFALIGAVWRPSREVRLALVSIVIIALPLALSYLFMPHYPAPAAALGGFIAVAGIRRVFLNLPRPRRNFRLLVMGLVLGQALSLAGDTSNQRRLEPRTLPTVRQKIEDQLITAGGQHLIFVRLVKPYYLHDTWVFNYAPIDAQPVIWAWDRGPEENRLLVARYRDRAAALLTVRDGEIELAPAPSGS